MDVVERSSPVDEKHLAAAVPARLRALTAVHLVLGTAPVATYLVSFDIRFLPVMWAFYSISFAQAMLLSFWAGMGTAPPIRRLFGAVGGCIYLAAWPAVAVLTVSSMQDSPITVANYYFALNCTIVLLFGGVLLLVRRRLAEVRFVANPESMVPSGRPRYSILHLLIFMLVVAIILALTRGATSGDRAVDDWPTIASNALMIVVFLVNTLCAAWATLSAGPVGWRILLVMLVATLLGISLSLSANFRALPDLPWWFFASQALVLVLPSVIVIASLLVVRSCGYRLVPKAKL